MKIYLIEEYGGEYEDSWTNIREKAYWTNEEAEDYLLNKGWEKKKLSGFISYCSNLSEEERYSSYHSPSGANILVVELKEKNNEK